MIMSEPGASLSHLSRDTYVHLIHTLRATLPPPPDASPEAEVRRDHAALTQVAALSPVNAAEAEVAAQFVATHAYAMDCLRLARLPDCAIDQLQRCGAQAATMFRHAQGAMRLLLRMQGARARRDSDQVSASHAAWAEHGAASWMLEGVGGAGVRDGATIPHPQDAGAESAGQGAAPSQDMGSNPMDPLFETDPDTPAASNPGQVRPAQPGMRHGTLSLRRPHPAQPPARSAGAASIMTLPQVAIPATLRRPPGHMI